MAPIKCRLQSEKACSNLAARSTLRHEESVTHDGERQGYEIDAMTPANFSAASALLYHGISPYTR